LAKRHAPASTGQAHAATLFECGLCYRDERRRDAAFFAVFFFADFPPAFFAATRFFARLADFAGGEGAGAADAAFRAPPRRASAVRCNATPAAAAAAARIASPAMSRTASAPLCAAPATFFWVVLFFAIGLPFYPLAVPSYRTATGISSVGRDEMWQKIY
jgi:hypothetical protein